MDPIYGYQGLNVEAQERSPGSLLNWTRRMIDIRKRHEAEEAVILEVVISGHHLGTWRGLPPTGRRVEFPLCGIFTFDDSDRLAGEKIYYDRAMVLAQLGVFHEPDRILGRLNAMAMHPLTMARILGRKLLRR